jgi:hypothetical protein
MPKARFLLVKSIKRIRNPSDYVKRARIPATSLMRSFNPSINNMAVLKRMSFWGYLCMRIIIEKSRFIGALDHNNKVSVIEIEDIFCFVNLYTGI